MAKAFTALSIATMEASLSAKLTVVTDNIRDLRTRFGMVNKAVALVWVEWSGDRRGRGAAKVRKRIDLLPVPVVAGWNLSTDTLAAGEVENGAVKVTEISGSYSQAILRGVEPGEKEPLPNVDFFYEITEITQQREAVKRRFTVEGVPDYNTAPPGWSVTLVRAYDDPDADSNSRE